jgi:hypothetical protein
MKKWILIILAVIVLLGVLFFKYVSFDAPCLPPEKPTNVPASAVWKGGCDGGSWIELVSIKEDKIRFRIYRDWNGKLILDADFENGDCDSFRLTETNWTEYAGDFINGNIGIHISSNAGVKCRLVPVYPAYMEEK